MYKTSFNGLKVSVNGVYSAYNLSQEELYSLKRSFGEGNVNGSNGNYTVFKNAKRKVILTLFIHELWIPICFDIRKDLLELYNSDRLYEQDIKALSKKLKTMRIQIHVEYDNLSSSWHIVDYDKFLALLQNLINT